MKTAVRGLAVAAISIIAMPSWAQQPPDSVSSDAYNNTAMGRNALLHQVAGSSSARDNTAAGASTLDYNTTGYANSAFGSNALTFTTSGGENTAAGYGALYRNTVGESNSAFGVGALNYNTTGGANTAMGEYSLQQNTTGGQNVAVGHQALLENSTGSTNTVVGWQSLIYNWCGNSNTAVGGSALTHNVCGSYNVAIGAGALSSVADGSNNIALGYGARSSIASVSNSSIGSNNIDIGNTGTSTDAGVIRIGTNGSQTSAFIAGIYASKLTGGAVYVTSTGQLGTLASSERYKTAIAPMPNDLTRLLKLRPVTFHLKSDPGGALQYGLIAEEVALIYPELVIRDEQGVIQGIRYEELSPMLLNAMQVQAAQMDQQDAQLKQQEQQMRVGAAQRTALADALTQLRGQAHAMLQAMQAMHARNRALQIKLDERDSRHRHQTLQAANHPETLGEGAK